MRAPSVPNATLMMCRSSLVTGAIPLASFASTRGNDDVALCGEGGPASEGSSTAWMAMKKGPVARAGEAGERVMLAGAGLVHLVTGRPVRLNGKVELARVHHDLFPRRITDRIGYAAKEKDKSYECLKAQSAASSKA